jgi:hypothetical protein
MDIGEEQEAIIVEPIEDPFRRPEREAPTPTPEREREREPEKV